VVVTYQVLLHPPAGDKPTTSLDHRAQELLEAANATAPPQNCSHSAGRCQATHCRSGLVPNISGGLHWPSFHSFSQKISASPRPPPDLPPPRCSTPRVSVGGARTPWGDGVWGPPDGFFSSPELCRRYAAASFWRFYQPHPTPDGLLCVTGCTLNVPGAIDCGRGLCQVALEGPRCLWVDPSFCRVTASTS